MTDEAAKREAVLTVVRNTFKPEFLNRLDDVIVFDALGTGELGRIVDLQVARLAKRLSDRRLTLTVTPAAREWLALTGYDPGYGARPLRRLVQSAIGDQLARALLSGQIADGDHVVVDTDDGADALTIRPAAAGGTQAGGLGPPLSCPRCLRSASTPTGGAGFSAPRRSARRAAGRSRLPASRDRGGSGSAGSAAGAARPDHRGVCIRRRQPWPSAGP